MLSRSAKRGLSAAKGRQKELRKKVDIRILPGVLSVLEKFWGQGNAENNHISQQLGSAEKARQ